VAVEQEQKRVVRAARGLGLRCRGWRQEGLLRLLENNLENGERPEDLVVYAALGKAARDWDSYEQIVSSLLSLRDEETLVVQSGKPIGRFATHPMNPIVVIANSNLVGRFATAEHFYELERENKIMWGGLTAGCWQYVGSQGILQGIYETFAQVARTHFNGSLRGKLVATAGLGGMGQSQALAIGRLLGGVVIVAEVDEEKSRRRVESGHCDRITDSLEQALAWARNAQTNNQPLAIALVANAVDFLEGLLAENVLPDVVTDMTSAHDARYGYQPRGMTLLEAIDLRRQDPDQLTERALDTIADHVRAMLEFKRRGVVTFDMGNNIRPQAAAHGVNDAFELGIFSELYLRPLFFHAIGAFRWIVLSGDPDELARIDQIALDLFAGNRRVTDWIELARKHVPIEGLPARVAWTGHGERTTLALRVNQEVEAGRLGPIAFTRDHLDAAAMAHPFIMTEALRDGTDAVADWPLLDALLLASACADLVAIHSGGGGYAGTMTSAGHTIIADGSQDAAYRLQHALTADTALGILRYADAGYQEAQEAAQHAHLGLNEPT
jgi:urocanate hydratase